MGWKLEPCQNRSVFIIFNISLKGVHDLLSRVDCNGVNSDGDDGRYGRVLGSNGVDCTGEDDDGDDSRYHDDELVMMVIICKVSAQSKGNWER